MERYDYLEEMKADILDYIRNNYDGEKILLSYDTQVLKIDKNGELLKLWDGKSNTTTAHIKAFCEFYGVDFRGGV